MPLGSCDSENLDVAFAFALRAESSGPALV